MGATISLDDLTRCCSNLSVSVPSVHLGLVRFQEIYGTVHGYVSVTLCLLGVVANVANIAVLTRKSMSVSSVNRILIAVAAADLFTMLTYFFQVAHFTLKNPTGRRGVPAELAEPHTQQYGWILYSLFTISLVLVLHTTACWLTVALAVFRYLYIAFPTTGARLASHRNVSICIAAICIACCLTSIPNYLVNAPRACRSPVTNATLYFIDAAQWVSDTLVLSNYWTIAILYKILPCLMLSAMTVLLIGQLSKSARRRRKLLNRNPAAIAAAAAAAAASPSNNGVPAGRREQRADKREQRTTRMLLAIVIVFLITELPQGVMSLLCFVSDSFEDNVYTPLGDLLDLLSLINNSVNFVLYTSMSKQFRDTFSAIFLTWLPRNAEPAAPEAKHRSVAKHPEAMEDYLGQDNTMEAEASHEEVPPAERLELTAMLQQSNDNN